MPFVLVDYLREVAAVLEEMYRQRRWLAMREAMYRENGEVDVEWDHE